jgi:hypothetical protein
MIAGKATSTHVEEMSQNEALREIDFYMQKIQNSLENIQRNNEATTALEVRAQERIQRIEQMLNSFHQKED